MKAKNTKIDEKVPTDFVIITDGGIANLAELLIFFRENPDYRTTIILTGSFYMDLKSEPKSNIRVLKAESGEDIIKLSKNTIMNNLIKY